MASRNDYVSDGAGYPTGASPTSARQQITYPRQTHTFVNYQAAVADVTKSKISPLSAKNGTSGVMEPRSHPTIRLPHIQHNTSTGVNSQHNEIEMTSAKKSMYHEAVSRKTQVHFDELLAKAFLGSRDSEAQQPVERKTRSSLAATHPSLYHNPPEKSPPTSMQSDKLVSSSPDESQSSTLPSSGLPPAALPWRKDTADPMWQTSSEPHYWTRNRTILKVDASVEHGNVVSPTWMVGTFILRTTLIQQLLTKSF